MNTPSVLRRNSAKCPACENDLAGVDVLEIPLACPHCGARLDRDELTSIVTAAYYFDLLKEDVRRSENPENEFPSARTASRAIILAATFSAGVLFMRSSLETKRLFITIALEILVSGFLIMMVWHWVLRSWMTFKDSMWVAAIGKLPICGLSILAGFLFENHLGVVLLIAFAVQLGWQFVVLMLASRSRSDATNPWLLLGVSASTVALDIFAIPILTQSFR